MRPPMATVEVEHGTLEWAAVDDPDDDGNEADDDGNEDGDRIEAANRTVERANTAVAEELTVFDWTTYRAS